MTDLTGRTIRGYEIHGKIREGGQGIVYKAAQVTANREVAVKVLHPIQINTTDQKQRFHQEAHVIAQLEHPYIVPLYDYWSDEEGSFLVMRWLRGGSLADLMNIKPLSVTRTLQMLTQIATALHVAHMANVIHRDIKPGNILFDDYSNAHLGDFGIAKRLDNPRPITGPGVLVGSPSYLAPEQIVRKRVLPQTDIYSLGVTLFEAMTGVHPFGAHSPVDMIMKHMQEPVPSLLGKNPNLPEALDSVIQKATDKDPWKRHPDALALLEDFRAAAKSG